MHKAISLSTSNISKISQSHERESLWLVSNLNLGGIEIAELYPRAGCWSNHIRNPSLDHSLFTPNHMEI